MRLTATVLGLLALAAPALARPTVDRVDRGQPQPASAQPRAAHPIEVSAAREAALQTARDARFDAQVRRVTNSICLGCTTPAVQRR